MRVTQVSVINGVAGEDLLYWVSFSDQSTGQRVSVSDWGRGLKVPTVNAEVEVRASARTWNLVDAASRRGRFPELGGLWRIGQRDTAPGQVGPTAYERGSEDGSTTNRGRTEHIHSSALRPILRLALALEPENVKLALGRFFGKWRSPRSED